MKALLLLPLILAGCSKPKEKEQVRRPSAEKAGTMAPAPKLADLTGLYEGGARDRRNQLCIAGRRGNERFGLVVWGGAESSCSGIGAVTRTRATVRLAMQGDAACAIAAKVEGKTLVFPATAPESCGYYCGARVSLGGVRFTQIMAGDRAAAKATDLVGDSLCG